MNREKLEMYDTLIKWFHTLDIGAAHENASDLSDGVAMAKALSKIAPDVFTNAWLAQIKVDTGANWRLKASNIRKIVDFLMDYYSDVLSFTFNNFPRIDNNKIAENHDETEIGRLLQLILGFAVNCPHNQEWIKQIRELEESLQRNIMKILQDLEAAWQNGPTSRTPSIMIDDETVRKERDNLAQKCHEAEQKIALLMAEKMSLQEENAKIMNELEKLQNSSAIGDDGISLGPVNSGSVRYNELRRKLDILKDELLQAETSRDDFKIKTKQQESEIAILRMKVDELNQATAELAVLKDEIDVLREASDKLKICEAQIATYKKKLEDYNDLKRQVKILEDRSADYYEQNVHHEENIKKIAAFKSQVNLYKQEIEELGTKLDTEIVKQNKTELELNNIQAKHTALVREKDSLLEERDLLRETCDELKYNLVLDGSDNISKELMVPMWREKIERLEAENKALRAETNGETARTQYTEDANQRIEKLRDELKQSNQKILLLTQNQMGGGDTNAKICTDQKQSPSDDGQTQLHAKISQLEATLSAREQDCVASEARYKKCVEKAKEIIKGCDPKGLLSELMTMNDKHPESEGENLQSQMGLLEEKLLTTAYYKLLTKSYHESVDTRLAKLAGGGQSFLTRQRQPAARKPIGYKNK